MPYLYKDKAFYKILLCVSFLLTCVSFCHVSPTFATQPSSYASQLCVPIPLMSCSKRVIMCHFLWGISTESPRISFHHASSHYVCYYYMEYIVKYIIIHFEEDSSGIRFIMHLPTMYSTTIFLKMYYYVSLVIMYLQLFTTQPFQSYASQLRVLIPLMSWPKRVSTRLFSSCISNQSPRTALYHASPDFVRVFH